MESQETFSCWIVLVFFSISDYAHFRFALTAFHNHLPSNPLKTFPYFPWILFILLFCPACPQQCFLQGLFVHCFLAIPLWPFSPPFYLLSSSAHISVSSVVSPSLTWVWHFSLWSYFLEVKFQFARAPRPKCHRLSALSNRNSLSHSLKARSPSSRCW